MKQEEHAVRTFEGLSHEQLLTYTRELSDHFQRERDLRHELAQREQQMRELIATATAAQEEERQWIAYEVHDRVAQTLASVFQQLQTLESMTAAHPQVRRVAVRASALAREAIREARNLMNDLHPPILDEFGVVPLIEEELRRFREDTKCRTRLDADYPERPSQEVEVALYRVFHEALLNVRRHATRARHVKVTLTCVDGIVSLQVRNDGPGFDVEAAESAKR